MAEASAEASSSSSTSRTRPGVESTASSSHSSDPPLQPSSSSSTSADGKTRKQNKQQQQQQTMPDTAGSESPKQHTIRDTAASTTSPKQHAALAPFGPPGSAKTTFREFLGISILVLSMLVTQSCLAEVLLPLTDIAETFGVADSAGEQSWFAAAYSLSIGTVILPAGQLGDIYGHKRIVLLGWGWACFWTLLAGISNYAKSQIFFDICRALQGTAFAVLLPNSVAILARSTDPEGWKRKVYFTVFAASAPNGFIIGAIFTSLIVQLGKGWPYSFYMGAICMAFVCALASWALPSDAYLTDFHRGEPMEDGDEVDASGQSHTPSFDYLGSIFAVSGLVLFIFSWNQAGVVGWSVAYNPVLLAIGTLLIAIFLYIETKVPHPLIPAEIWTVQNSIVLGCVALGWSSFGIWAFYSFRWWLDIHHSTLLSAVAQSAPAGVAGCFAAGTSVLMLVKFGPPWVMLSAMTAFCVANLLMATQPAYQLYWKQSFPSWIIAPFGMDASFPAASLIVAASLPPQRQGVAGSVVNTLINASIALGLGFAGTVEAQTNDGGSNTLHGYKMALFLGTGLAGLGVILASANLVGTLIRNAQLSKSKGGVDQQEEKGGRRGAMRLDPPA